MNNNKKKYSIAAHLLHSRLEMIRADIIIKVGAKEWDRVAVSQTVVFDNSWLFKKACESIKRDFDVNVTTKDACAAADLFIIAQQSTERSPVQKYRIEQFVESGWVNVTQMPGNNPISAELTFKEACSHFNYLNGNRDHIYRIVKADPK